MAWIACLAVCGARALADPPAQRAAVPQPTAAWAVKGFPAAGLAKQSPIYGAYFFYADSYAVVPPASTSISAKFAQGKPRVAAGDSHSLMEISASSADQQNIVEIGWTVDAGVNGDTAPHLFVFHWVGGVPTCYDGCGYVQLSQTRFPGMQLDVTETPQDYAIQFRDGNWFVGYQGEWIGYFPGTIWNGTYTQIGIADWFGEVAAGADVSCTQMGDGLLGTEAESAAIVDQRVGDQPAAAVQGALTNPAWYALGNFTGASLTLGGPGACAAAHVNLDQHGLSGSWFNPATPGQGVEIETYPDAIEPAHGLLFAGWFTYDASAGGGRRWYGLSGDFHADDASAALQIFDVEGGNFAAGPAVGAKAIGTATLRFADCTSALLDYRFTDGSGRAGSVPLARLTPNVTCTPSADSGAAASSYLLSGNWFDPGASGQGLMFDFNPALTLVFAAWYTFAPHGAEVGGPSSQDWYTLQASGFAPGASALGDIPIVATSGGAFDRGAATQSSEVGRAAIAFDGCDALTLQYRFSAGVNSGAAGTLHLVRAGPTPAGCTLH